MILEYIMQEKTGVIAHRSYAVSEGGNKTDHLPSFRQSAQSEELDWQRTEQTLQNALDHEQFREYLAEKHQQPRLLSILHRWQAAGRPRPTVRLYERRSEEWMPEIERFLDSLD